MRPLTVLVTDASYKHSVGIIRSLGGRGHHVMALAYSRLAPGLHSRYVHRSFIAPNPAQSPAEFVSVVCAHVADSKIDLVIPVGFAAIDALSHSSEARSELQRRALLPSAEQFDLASDKWVMIQRVKSLGIAAPDSVLASDFASHRYFAEKYRRLVLKSRRESLGKGIKTLHFASDQSVTSQDLMLAVGQRDPEQVILQAFVPGQGAGYMALCIGGQVVREFTHCRLREWPPEGGYATAAIATDDPELAQMGRKIVASLSWNGPAMVEFRRGEQGTFFIEFNPKFWGSLELALAAGADFPGDLCSWSLGTDLGNRAIPPARHGQRFWWPWRGDLRRLLRRPSDTLRVLRDLASPGAKSNWSWSDPIPNLIEIGGELLYPLRRHD